jgi:hypothetical protein
MASIARVVVEAGSDWPAFVRGAADEVVALSQATEDADGGALERACGRENTHAPQCGLRS